MKTVEMSEDDCEGGEEMDVEDSPEVLNNRKLYIDVHVSIFHEGGRFYSLGYEYGTSSGGTPCRNAQEVIDKIKNLLKCPSSTQGDNGSHLTASRVVVKNSTSIKINIPALLAQKSGNSLMGFCETKVSALPIDEEAIDPQILKDNELQKKIDQFEHDVIGPLREKMSNLANEARMFGLPENTGWSCWKDKRAKSASIKKFPEAKELFGKLDDLQKEFEAAYDRKHLMDVDD